MLNTLIYIIVVIVVIIVIILLLRVLFGLLLVLDAYGINYNVTTSNKSMNILQPTNISSLITQNMTNSSEVK